MIIPVGFARCFILFSNALPHECQNTIDLALDDVFDDGDANAVANAIAPSYKAMLNTASTFHGVRVLIGQDGGDPLEVFSTLHSGPGTASGALAPAQVQGLIKKHTSHAGRKGRGRCYLPDVQEAHINDSGIADSTQQGLWQDVANALLDLPSSVGSPISGVVLLHEDGSTPYGVTSISVEPAVATQRRRWPRPA